MIRTVPVMRGAQGVNYMKTCLSIAGSDCSGGAGIQADLKTFSALDTFGMSVIVSVVAENTATVKSIHEVPCEIIADQIDCVFTDIPPDAVKIGMLPTSEIMRTVAAGLRAYRATPLVVDPVMVAKNGAALMYEEARATLLTEILPLATVLTPNLPEAEVILGRSIATLEEMRAAAADIAALGPASVLVKGGHRMAEDGQAHDVLFSGGRYHDFSAPRIDTPNTHGTGCTLSSAIAAYLARGCDVVEAVERSKSYIQGAIEHALPLGHGNGPTDHFWCQHTGTGNA